jgi:hypothetical protein
MQASGQKIFFSYARKDKEFALKLAEDMRAAGLELWIDVLDIRTGTQWDRAVEGALKDCPGFLVILSPDAIASQAVQDEVSFAVDQGKAIFPVLYRKCDVPYRIRRFQFADFTEDYGAARSSLLAALNAPTPNNKPQPQVSPVALYKRVTRRQILLIGAVTLLVAIGALATIFWERLRPPDEARYGFPSERNITVQTLAAAQRALGVVADGNFGKSPDSATRAALRQFQLGMAARGKWTREAVTGELTGETAELLPYLSPMPPLFKTAFERAFLGNDSGPLSQRFTQPDPTMLEALLQLTGVPSDRWKAAPPEERVKLLRTQLAAIRSQRNINPSMGGVLDDALFETLRP